jgi:pyruvate/2-oxoglutarate dehydrogenase complex dihydrolipoamide acyltransferase (E2) component
MPYDVKLPDIGEGIAEGEIVRWLVKPGEAVREDQPLVEVMTDKATVEIPSPRTGVIASIAAAEGEVVPVGSVIVSIALAGEAEGAGAASVAAAAQAAAQALQGATGAALAPARAAAGGAVAAPSRVQATPAVRQLAKQLGVALESIGGSGPGGAITADDVKRAAGGAGAGAGAAAAPARPAAAPPAPPAPARPASAAPDAHAPAAPGVESEEAGRIPLRGLRRRIAEHMRHSLDTAAHFTFVAECDMTAVVAHRDRLKAKAGAEGARLTYLAYIVKALIEPLRQYPMLNASLDDARSEIVLKRDLHIGIATATAEGLTVPVLHHADRFGLIALAREIQRLAEAARAHRLKLEELQGGTFTVTSTGAKGGVLATPIIHHPQVAILGVHEVKPKPAVVDGAIVARDLGNLSLALDHRVVDGAVGADFLYAVIERLEHPERWLTAEDAQ